VIFFCLSILLLFIIARTVGKLYRRSHILPTINCDGRPRNGKFAVAPSRCPYDAISLKLQQRGHLSVSTPWHCVTHDISAIEIYLLTYLLTYGRVVPLYVADNTTVQNHLCTVEWCVAGRIAESYKPVWRRPWRGPYTSPSCRCLLDLQERRRDSASTRPSASLATNHCRNAMYYKMRP